MTSVVTARGNEVSYHWWLSRAISSMSGVVLLGLCFSFLSFSALLSTKSSGIYLLCALSLVSHEVDQVGEVLRVVHHLGIHHGSHLSLGDLHLVLGNGGLL